MDAMTAEWVRLARRDIRLAVLALQSDDWENALYLAHQAVEKALKAIIQSRSSAPPSRTHNLAFLAEVAGASATASPACQELLDTLDPYAVIGRYAGTTYSTAPLVKPGDARSLIGRAEELCTCLLNELT